MYIENKKYDLDDSTTKPTSATQIPANSIDNSLHGLFTAPTTAPAVTVNANNSAMVNFDDDLEKAFSSTSNESTSTNNMMTNDKIMALFNTPSSSNGNIRPAAPMQLPNSIFEIII